MSRSCQSATFSSPTSARAADDARQPADPLGDDRVPLVRHRGRALLAAAERLLDLAHLRPREVADLEREPLERGGQQRERVQHLGVAVALEDLRRARRRLEAEPLAGDPLDLGIGGGSRCRPRRRACRRASPRARARRRARSRSSANAQPASLRPNVVGSAWTPCVRPIVIVSPVLLGPRGDGGERALESRRGSARPPRGAAATSAVSSTSDEVRP